MLKVIYEDNQPIKNLLANGMKIGSQYIHHNDIEMERFTNLKRCTRCYAFEHLVRNCPLPTDYKICSECSHEGHRFNQCTKTEKKCILCAGQHSTMAYKCPERKNKIKQLENKKNEKIKDQMKSDIQTEIEAKMDSIFKKMPANFLTTIATAVTIANIKEKEWPGTFQQTITEIYKANGLQNVVIPPSIFNAPPLQPMETSERKKRDREEEPEEQFLLPSQPIEIQYSTTSVTPATSLQSIPAEVADWANLVPVPSAPTPTPNNTPVPTPESSPARTTTATTTGAISKEKRPKKTETKKGKQEKRGDPEIILIAPSNMNFRSLSEKEIHDELRKARYMKYIYQNSSYPSSDVKDMIDSRFVHFSAKDIFYLNIKKFNQIVNGCYYNLNR